MSDRGHYCWECGRYWVHKNCQTLIKHMIRDECLECNPYNTITAALVLMNGANNKDDWWFVDEFADWVRSVRDGAKVLSD